MVTSHTKGLSSSLKPQENICAPSPCITSAGRQRGQQVCVGRSGRLAQAGKRTLHLLYQQQASLRHWATTQPARLCKGPLVRSASGSAVARHCWKGLPSLFSRSRFRGLRLRLDM